MNGKVLHKLSGSPLDCFYVDGEVFWELETIDIIIPNESECVLSSDSRCRADLISLSKSDIDGAEKEKAILEEAQRKDKKLRESMKKNS